MIYPAAYVEECIRQIRATTVQSKQDGIEAAIRHSLAESGAVMEASQ